MKLWPLGVLIALTSCQKQEPEVYPVDPTNWDFHHWVAQQPEEPSFPISLERKVRVLFRLPLVEQGGGEYSLRLDYKMKNGHHAEILGDLLFTLQANQDVEYDFDFHIVLQEDEILGVVALDPEDQNLQHAGRLSMDMANQLLHSANIAQEEYLKKKQALGLPSDPLERKPLGAYLHPAAGLSTLANTLFCESWNV